MIGKSKNEIHNFEVFFGYPAFFSQKLIKTELLWPNVVRLRFAPFMRTEKEIIDLFANILTFGNNPKFGYLIFWTITF